MIVEVGSKWINKDELRAFENSQKEKGVKTVQTGTLIDATQLYRRYDINLEKVTSVDDCKKLIRFLCGVIIKPLPDGVEYNGFDEVCEYFDK